MTSRRAGTNRRKATLGVGLVVLAIAVGACGGGSSQAGARVSVSGPPKGDPMKVLSAAATATNAVGTARMEMLVGFDFSGLPGQAAQNLSMSGTGAFDLAHKSVQLEMNLGKLAGGKVLRMIVIGTTVYLDTTTLGLTGVKPWITMPTSATGSGLDYTQLAQSAFNGTKLLTQLQGVTVVGTETVKTAATTHYRGTLDLGKALGALGNSDQSLSQLGSAGGSIQSALASINVPVNAWIDGQDRLRRFTMTMDLAPMLQSVMGSLGASGQSSPPPPTNLKASIDLDYTLYDFGASISIAAPPATDVGPAPANFKLPGTSSSPM